jgi:hypothetical protein
MPQNDKIFPLFLKRVAESQEIFHILEIKILTPINRGAPLKRSKIKKSEF